MEKSINKMSAISGNESKITPVFLMDEVRKSIRKLQWKKVSREMGISFILLYLYKSDLNEVVCVEFENPHIINEKTEKQLTDLLPYQENVKDKDFTNNIQPDSTILPNKLMDFIRFFNEGHLSEERIVIILDRNLINSQIKDLGSGETLSITQKDSSLAFILSNKLNLPPKLQEIKAEIIKSKNKKIADITVEELIGILKDSLNDKSNDNDASVSNSKQRKVEEKINVTGTDFYYSELAVYYKEKVLYKLGTAKYNLFTILAKEEKPIDRIRITEELKMRGTNYEPSSIGALVAKVNGDIRSITNNKHRGFIKNIQKNRSNTEFGYYFDAQLQHL